MNSPNSITGLRVATPQRVLRAIDFNLTFTDSGAIRSLFINNTDSIRQIEKPDESFEYYVYGKSGKLDGHTVKERMNERRREAVDGKLPAYTQ